MYCTVLCLALLPFVSSNILDIFAGKSLLNFFIFFLCLLSSFVCLFSILGIPSFSVVWCIVSSLHIAVCSVQVHRPLSSCGNPIAINKYHIIFHKTATYLQWAALFLFRITLSPSASFCLQNLTNFGHQEPCNSSRSSGLQLGSFLPVH